MRSGRLLLLPQRSMHLLVFLFEVLVMLNVVREVVSVMELIVRAHLLRGKPVVLLFFVIANDDSVTRRGGVLLSVIDCAADYSGNDEQKNRHQKNERLFHPLLNSLSIRFLVVFDECEEKSLVRIKPTFEAERIYLNAKCVLSELCEI